MLFQHIRRYAKKIGTGIAGGLVVLIGLVLIPYPGPGWLVVFAGLAILATEFEFAARILKYAKGKYDAWAAWVKKQGVVVQLALLVLTALVVVGTTWLVNGFGIINKFLSLHQVWLISPFFR